jgi:nicotinamidase-related amidase
MENRVTGSALLVIDVQQGTLERVVDGHGIDPQYVNRVRQAIDAARAASIAVIYARVAFRPGAPEANPNNRMVYGMAKTGARMMNAPDSQIHPAIAPLPDDIIVTKSRPSAFSGTDLDLILRSLRIDHLALAGVATRMGILATFLAAADKDYRLTVLSDGCADWDDALHDTLMAKIFPLQADVLPIEAWTRQLAAIESGR